MSDTHWIMIHLQYINSFLPHKLAPQTFQFSLLAIRSFSITQRSEIVWNGEMRIWGALRGRQGRRGTDVKVRGILVWAWKTRFVTDKTGRADGVQTCQCRERVYTRQMRVSVWVYLIRVHRIGHRFHSSIVHSIDVASRTAEQLAPWGCKKSRVSSSK